MTLQKGICEECKKEYEYEYNPKYPRKYCPECSAKKKAEYEATQTGKEVPVVKPGEPVKAAQNGSKHTTMYVSYAKDIFCAMIALGENKDNTYIMETAIGLVKQAQKEFS